jgi:hypothetical protein
MVTSYDIQKAQYCATYCHESRQESGEEAIRHSPLVSLAVKSAIDASRPSPTLPQYGLL